jgi:hypothetical protein
MAINHSTVVLMIGDGQPDQLSAAARGDGYYGYKDGNHTVSVQFQQFKGRIQIEATLELEPTETDWFPIWLTGVTPYKQYNDPMTGTDAFTFQGNFVLVRFRKSRSYLSSSSANSPLGDITKVMLSI